MAKEALKSDSSRCKRILLDMAFQPAARGGPRHFTAGNIRLVTKARALLKSEKEQEEFTGNEEWSNDQWKLALLNHFKMKESDEGRLDREQLVLYGQAVYSCILCCALI